MRSRALFYRSKYALRPNPYPPTVTHFTVIWTACRKSLHASAVTRARRNLSSSVLPDPEIPTPPEENEEVKAKPKGRAKRSQDKPDPPSPPQLDNAGLPPDLDILWTPDAEHTPIQSALPPPELLQDALINLLITLHPQTQHRATYASPNGSPVEPTLALYCPIEGGDYVIDETVRELARRARAEVVVLDTIEVAAGEWGAFGKGEPFCFK